MLSVTSIFFEHKTNDKNISKPTKFPREDPEGQVLAVSSGTSSSLSQEMLQIPSNNFRCKEKIALKLSSVNEKRYELHKTFLSKCHRDIIIPHRLSVYVEPSVGNQDEAFLITWHKNFQWFSSTIMSQVINFCNQTISKVNEEIKKKTKAELHTNLDRNECEEIISTLQKNDELKPKHLQQRKMPIAIVWVEAHVLRYLQQNTEKNKNEVLQYGIDILKKEVESVKQDNSVVSQIPTRRESLPYPQSKSSPQTVAVEITQKEWKNRNAVSIDGGQKQQQIKQVIKFIESTMQTLLEYKKQYEELLKTDLTQTEI